MIRFILSVASCAFVIGLVYATAHAAQNCYVDVTRTCPPGIDELCNQCEPCGTAVLYLTIQDVDTRQPRGQKFATIEQVLSDGTGGQTCSKTCQCEPRQVMCQAGQFACHYVLGAKEIQTAIFRAAGPACP